jgi:protein-arginine kinase
MSNQTIPDPYYDLIMDEYLARNEWPEKLDAYRADPSHASLMAQVMTKDIFDGLKHHKTALAGWTIARAINTGTCHPSSFVGCHAGDRQSYSDFRALFQPVIEAYHKGFKMKSQSHQTDLDVNAIRADFSEQAKAKIASTRIRVARNLSRFPLNPGGTKQSRLDILDLLKSVTEKLTGDLAGRLLPHATMTPKQEQDLIDQRLLFRGRDMMQAASGYHMHWPAGRAIFVNATRDFVLWINEGDHLRIISMQDGSDVRGVFNRLARGIAAIEAGLRDETGRDDVFMTDPVLGTLTCCPSNLGTAMRGSVHLVVPKLIANLGLEGIENIARGFNCQARGSSGEHSDIIEKVDISNSRRLGLTEANLVDDMINCVNDLTMREDRL